jgi:hypothetical protein
MDLVFTVHENQPCRVLPGLREEEPLEPLHRIQASRNLHSITLQNISIISYYISPVLFPSTLRHHALAPTQWHRPARNRRLRARRGRPTRNITPVVRHVRFDKVARAQGAVEGQFTGQDARGNDARELARIVAGRGLVGAAHAEQVEHGGLGLEDGAAADGADFDGRHRDGDLEVAVDAGKFVRLGKRNVGEGKHTCS